MANKTDVKDAPARDEVQISLGPDPAVRKVELDLDDAPFLKEEQEAASPAVQDDKKLPAQVAPDPKAEKKQKLLIFGAGAAALLRGLEHVAALPGPSADSWRRRMVVFSAHSAAPSS